MMRYLMVWLMVTMLGGCAGLENIKGHVQFYPGASLPPAQIALINGHDDYRKGSLANYMLRIVAVNDQKIPGQGMLSEGANEVAVTPGLYLVKVLFVSGYQDVDFYSYDTLLIQAQPGCRYQLVGGFAMPSRVITFDVLAAPMDAGMADACKKAPPPKPLEQGSSSV
jgi:hypothetical protein